VRPYASLDVMAIGWIATAAPWTASWVVQLVGKDADGADVTATVSPPGGVAPGNANLTALFNANPTDENPNGDGTWASYSFSFLAPAKSDDDKDLAGAHMIPTVKRLNNDASMTYYDAELASDEYNTQNVTLRDPTELTTSITVTGPAYGASFAKGGAGVEVTWTGTGLLASDTL
jgi:hypothetical protein